MNNMLVEVLRMRAQGMTPMAARQTLLQRFPQTQRLARLYWCEKRAGT